jgi:hypothetical protein
VILFIVMLEKNETWFYVVLSEYILITFNISGSLYFLSDVTNCSFVVFQIWDLPGHLDYFDSTFDSEHIFGGCGALIFVIDSQVGNSFVVQIYVRRRICILHFIYQFTRDRNLKLIGHSGFHAKIVIFS